MARKPNYNFEKRRKEMDRKAKKDAKREDRARRRQEEPADTVGTGEAPASDEPSTPQDAAREAP